MPRMFGGSYEGTSAKQVILGGAGWTAEFRNCSFDNTRLKYIIGEAKFINCTFRNARLTEFRVNPLTLINCDFSGALLRRCQIWGAPTPHDLKDRPFLDPVNEVHGNNFSTATFDEELATPHDPETEEYGISSVVFRTERPFNKDRLLTALRGSRGLVRSKGYCWLDTRLNLVFSWQQAGPNLCIEPVGTWGTATPRSEVVLIGIDLDAPALLRSFEQAVVTDAEAAALLPS